MRRPAIIGSIFLVGFFAYSLTTLHQNVDVSIDRDDLQQRLNAHIASDLSSLSLAGGSLQSVRVDEINFWQRQTDLRISISAKSNSTGQDLYLFDKALGEAKFVDGKVMIVYAQNTLLKAGVASKTFATRLSAPANPVYAALSWHPDAGYDLVDPDLPTRKATSAFVENLLDHVPVYSPGAELPGLVLKYSPTSLHMADVDPSLRRRPGWDGSSGRIVATFSVWQLTNVFLAGFFGLLVAAGGLVHESRHPVASVVKPGSKSKRPRGHRRVSAAGRADSI
jgi:hypothetical protein